MYRKRIDGRTEAWIARADGSGARKIARLASDVEEMAWSPDGTHLRLASRPGLAAERERLKSEALSGYVYDDRFQPAYQMQPLPTAEPLAASSVDLATGAIENVSEAERARLFPDFRLGAAAAHQLRSPNGQRALLVGAGGGILGGVRVTAETTDGRMVACMAATCSGAIKSPLWIGEDLVYLRLEGWADRRSVLDALERTINEAVRIGVADPARIGMTGLSDGSTTTAFALINSRYHVAAAAMSSCCMEPAMVLMTGGPRFAEAMKAEGYPPFGDDDRAFWAPMSVARNADRIDTPILMQMADREYMLGLEAWTALNGAQRPVEMIV